ncbi:hypothetical protein JL722_15292 [Aureococcus anophagefferens]|nr:hypothetical protein JL722_15292 [Aureococcus anophagefferens]
MGRGSMVTIKLSPPAAKDAADALAKALYGRLFDWLVVKINASISRGEGACHVGVLDIFGFEVFKVNSFEQLCINYTNEKLQLFFNDVVFGEEMKMYESEGVPLRMAFEDNASAARTNAYFGGKDPSGRSFAVRHFAGAVTYDTAGFVEKNRDTISTTLSTLCMEAAVPLVARGGFDLVRKHGKNLPADVALTCCENILNDPANLAALLAADGAKDAPRSWPSARQRLPQGALAQKALETRRARAMESFVVLCQAAWRSFAARSRPAAVWRSRGARRRALRKQRAKAAGDLVTRWIRGARVRRSLAGARKNLAGLRAAAKRTAAPRSRRGAAGPDGAASFLEAQTGPDGAPRADLKCFAGPPKAGEPSAHLLARGAVAREALHAAAPPPSPPADAAPATPDRRYSDVSGASTPEASPTRRGGEDPEALGAVVFEGLGVAAARRAYCAASFVDGTAAPPQIAAALAAPAAAWEASDLAKSRANLKKSRAAPADEQAPHHAGVTPRASQERVASVTLGIVDSSAGWARLREPRRRRGDNP